MFENIFFHRHLLADRVRMKAYQKAIHEVVKEGDVVADIGTGTGILAFFALQAGAGRVYAIEKSDVIELAENLTKINGLEKRIVFIRGRSDRVELPEKVDVITSEIISSFGLGQNVLKFKIDARKRFVKPGGRLVPSWLELYLVPVESEAIWKDYIGIWSNNFYGFDFSPVRSYAVSQKYAMDCSGKVNQLAIPSMISHFEFYEIERVPLVFKDQFIINKKGPFHGLMGYFRAGLSQSVVLSTSPERPLTCWGQTFFPMKDVVMVESGDEVFCKIKGIPQRERVSWQWETDVHRSGVEVAKFIQSDFAIKEEEVVTGQKNFKPVLKQEGEICRRVFDLCDGNRTMGEIVETLWAEFSEEYRDIKDVFQTVVGILSGKVMSAQNPAANVHDD